jgi:hypothetical protein
MLARSGHLAFIVHLIVWLNVVIPGHTRGRFTIGPASPSAPSSCCDSRASQSRDRNHTPTPDERSRCAICFFAAGLHLPNARIAAPTPGALITTLAPPTLNTPPSCNVSLPYDGRAPPLAA